MTDKERDQILSAALLKHRRAMQTRSFLKLLVNDLSTLVGRVAKLLSQGDLSAAVELAGKEKRFSVDALNDLTRELAEARSAVREATAECGALGVYPSNDDERH